MLPCIAATRIHSRTRCIAWLWAINAAESGEQDHHGREPKTALDRVWPSTNSKTISNHCAVCHDIIGRAEGWDAVKNLTLAKQAFEHPRDLAGALHFSEQE